MVVKRTAMIGSTGPYQHMQNGSDYALEWSILQCVMEPGDWRHSTDHDGTIDQDVHLASWVPPFHSPTLELGKPKGVPKVP